MNLSFAIVAVVIAAAGSSAYAQDTRTVTEPRIPAFCTSLMASLQSTGGKLAEADETKLDTQRIQAAIDGCASGKAVELKVASGRNAFLSGPLQLRAGVTLVVDAGRVVNPEGLRFDDEFVRHKLLDAVGDLALAGGPICGRFVADQPGHALNARLVRALLDTPEAWRWELESSPETVRAASPALAAAAG